MITGSKSVRQSIRGQIKRAGLTHDQLTPTRPRRRLRRASRAQGPCAGKSQRCEDAILFVWEHRPKGGGETFKQNGLSKLLTSCRDSSLLPRDRFTDWGGRARRRLLARAVAVPSCFSLAVAFARQYTRLEQASRSGRFLPLCVESGHTKCSADHPVTCTKHGRIRRGE